jgi:hypothetical protein
MNYREFVDIVNDIEDILKEVQEWLSLIKMNFWNHKYIQL